MVAVIKMGVLPVPEGMAAVAPVRLETLRLRRRRKTLAAEVVALGGKEQEEREAPAVAVS